MTRNRTPTDAVLTEAARDAGLDPEGAELIRDGSNIMYSLPGGIVARIGKSDTEERARREVRTARWLTESGISVVQPLEQVPQAQVITDRPVTWWTQLPAHRPGTPAELATLLRAVHQLPVPVHLNLPRYDPFNAIEQRITEAPKLTDEEQGWLAEHLEALRRAYTESVGESYGVIHGDAWQGNVAVPESGKPILLDLEAVALGRRDWDLVQIAVDHTDFARLSAEDYRAFVDAYGGYDVTTTKDFRTLADIQELRWVCFALSKADTSPEAECETQHRLACLRGEVERPWTWSAF